MGEEEFNLEQAIEDEIDLYLLVHENVKEKVFKDSSIQNFEVIMIATNVIYGSVSALRAHQDSNFIMSENKRLMERLKSSAKIDTDDKAYG